MAIITLTTDFGTMDTYVGVMKGVILGIAPGVAIVDLCHEIPPRDILAGALALESAVDYFPKNTIHLAVVDPGVGGDRNAIAVQTERFAMVGPDNGIFTLALAKSSPVGAVRLTNAGYQLAIICATFHGRDIFAPAAAYLALGVDIMELGEPITELTKLSIPAPSIANGETELTVLRADRFGNLITNLTREEFETWRPINDRSLTVRMGEIDIGPIHRTYADVESGNPVAYFGSGGRLEIGVRNGSAAEEFTDTRSIRVIAAKG